MHPFFAFGLPHGTDWIWIALIVVLVFGAEKLPKLARGLGKSLGEFKKAKDEFDREIRTSVATDDAKALEQKSGVTITQAPTATPVSSTPAGDEPSKKI